VARGGRPTMIDVAKHAGVSLKTVSRVINQVRTVDQALADRVYASVKELGFHRNPVAASLRAGSSDLIGLVTADLSNPFYTALASAISAVAIPRGYQVVMASSEEDPRAERDIAVDLCQRRVAGLIIVPTRADHSYLTPEVQLGTPVVFLDRPGNGLPADAVLIDNRGGAQAAVRQLLARGHRRIGLLLDSPAIFTMRERLAGIEAAFAELGLAPDPALVAETAHAPGTAEEAADRFLDLPEPPTALFCANNLATVGAAIAVTRRGADVEVSGFDDFETARLLPRPATLVGYDTRAMGTLAATALFDRIDGDDAPARQTLVPTSLITRGGLRPRVV
jgi:LacI family transcriptional regulator